MSYDVLDPVAARLWPYVPDWSASFRVRRSFKTDLRASRDNTEQRRATRTNPRFAIEYRATVWGDDLRPANHFMRAWQNKSTLIPDFARWARLTGASSGGTDTLTISPIPPWAAEGQRLVLCGNGVAEEVGVESAAGSTITLTANLVNAWGIDAVLRPTFFGLFEGRLQSGRVTPGAASIEVSLSVYPGGEPPREEGTAWATFNGREVFTPQPDYAGAPSLSYIWPVDEVDYGYGRTAQFRPIDRGERLVEADFNGLNVEAATQLEQFFDRMKGRRTAFYKPTGEKDFALNATAAAGATTFTATGPDIATDFGAIDYSTVETAIAVCMTDGSHIYRRVTDIGASGGNSLITVNAAWGAELSASSVARISWMPVCRFASDEMVTAWRTPLTAGARLTFQSVKR